MQITFVGCVITNLLLLFLINFQRALQINVCIFYHYMYVTPRRVHISQSTLDALGKAYEVEPGNGSERDSYLEGMTTYLIVQKVRAIY